MALSTIFTPGCSDVMSLLEYKQLDILFFCYDLFVSYTFMSAFGLVYTSVVFVNYKHCLRYVPAALPTYVTLTYHYLQLLLLGNSI